VALVKDLGTHTRTLRAERKPAVALQALRVLLVDDNEVNLEVGRDILGELGHTVETASTGRQAAERAQTNAYDVVLMDIQMPDMNGYEATAALRRQESETGRARRVVIAMTAHAFEGERQKALAAGMDDYLTKPIRLETLRDTLARWGLGASEPKVAAPAPGAAAPAANAGDPAAILAAGPVAASAVSDLVDAILDSAVTRKPKIVNLFLLTTPARIDALKLAVNEANSETIRDEAHTLKGSCLTLGVPRMTALCRALELAETDRAPALLAALEAEFEVARQALSNP
jgi:CheY-like chemotaxis protein